jgi:hypothetical protein
LITVKNISPTEKIIYMQMKEGDTLFCEATAEIQEDCAQLMDIKEYQKGFSYDMGKAILNAIDLKEIKKVVCYNKNLHDTLIKLRFNEANCAYFLSLEGYFSSNCEN